MNRRQFVTLTGASLLSISVVPAVNAEPVSKVSGLTVADALQTLDQLQKAEVSTLGKWNLFQVYTHLAQSVEYSMTGYPEQKSWLFKSTVGSLAFSVFSGKGSMNHGLDEAIPGAPALSEEGDPQQALQRLRQSLMDFVAFDGNLQPHFAYGELSKAEYEQAHVMHLNNHLDELELA
mgnify:CR=1 FL=1